MSSAPEESAAAAAGPLYQQLAEQYRRAIASGSLGPGSRMPSVRTLMARHGVSLSTALQACRSLEGEGLLEARPRLGYFVQGGRTRSLPPAREPQIGPPDPARYVGIHERISGLLARGMASVVRVNLAGAVAHPALYPTRALALQGQRVLRQPERLAQQPPADGYGPLRDGLARLALEAQMVLRPDELLVTHGATEALALALRAVTQPGDVVAVESPSYFGVLQILEALGLRALEIPTSPATGLNVEALALALAAEPALRAVVVVPNLQNPLGAVMPDAAKQALLRLAQAHDLALIEDGSYAPLTDAPQRALKSWDREGRVIYCASMHKILAPGLRLGWMSAGRWQDRVRMLKYAQSRPNELLGQAMVAGYLAAGQMPRHLRELRRRLSLQRRQMAEALADELPEGTRLTLPAGGLALWVELAPGLSSLRLFDAALHEGIRLSPGMMFSNDQRFDGYLRINCGEPMDAGQRDAVRTLGRLCRLQLGAG